jgi:hypothetical protein
MCWQCEHPGSTREDYLEHVRRLIGQSEWVVQAVNRDRIRPPWSYTVGLTEHGLPELAMTGLAAPRAALVLNTVAAYVLETSAPRPGDTMGIEDDDIMMEVVQVSEPAVHLLIAAEIYGPGLRALQLVHADDRGHWPWCVGYRGMRGGQPVLGRRATAASGQRR